MKDGVEPPSIKVARINFAFDNNKLWELLEDRGDLHKNAQFDKVTKIEETTLNNIKKNRE